AEQLSGRAVVASRNAPAGIIRATGTHLVLDGEPWRFVGFNDYQLTSQSYSGYTCGGQHSDAEVAFDFAQMHRLGATVVRTWFFQSYVAGRNWSAFDRVLTNAARYGIRIIPVLSNQWGTCEDYNRTPVRYKTLAWYRAGYRTDLDYGMPLSYRTFALAVARHYAGDARIAFWQLMNEAEAADSLAGRCQEAAAAGALRRFGDDMAGSLKAVDPDHLVSLGTIGGGQCGTAGADFPLVHAGSIDMCEVHDYTPTPQSAPRANPCLSLHKPMFIGERGFVADLGTGSTTPQTLTTRARYVKADIAGAFAEDACDGYLLWSWTSGSSQSYGVGPGDPAGSVLLTASRTLTTARAVYLTLVSNLLRGGRALQSDY
ncbi:MAG: cellulase family glycosylhydrolase, partial [Candidatus Dormibacteraeota bacterium]|nr:cellulase family glycosylhydrolase [Candidatus Dormibacteraeota bacterium]